MRRPGRAVVALIVLTACARFRVAPPPEGDDPSRLVARADELAHTGSPRAARELYRKVVRLHRDSPAAANALYGLGRLYVDPGSPVHDWDAAHVAFGRLVTEHRDSVHADEARAWVAALDEMQRAQAEANRLRTDLERLKEIDMEQERHR
jgi:tetratricopeptide (TPR) repeat protein